MKYILVDLIPYIFIYSVTDEVNFNEVRNFNFFTFNKDDELPSCLYIPVFPGMNFPILDNVSFSHTHGCSHDNLSLFDTSLEVYIYIYICVCDNLYETWRGDALQRLGYFDLVQVSGTINHYQAAFILGITKPDLYFLPIG